MVERGRMGSNKKREMKIKYPDKQWTVYEGPSFSCDEYRKGRCGELYCLSVKHRLRSAFKFGDDGKKLGRLELPDTRYKPLISPEIETPRNVDRPMKVVIEYGDPVLASNGDVYTWKRTEKTYSIIKWVWIDGPDAPRIPDVKYSGTGLLVNWKKPKKGSAGVKGYEVERSQDVCGPYQKVGETKGGVLKFLDAGVEAGKTYYYRVRAVTTKGSSGYSNKAVGLLDTAEGQ
jgi:hypothetical protein